MISQKTIISFALVFFIHFFSAFAQEYVSSLEEAFFTAYEKDSLNYNFFQGLCVVDSTVTKDKVINIEKKLTQFIDGLPDKEESDKKEKRRIKAIYNQIHKKFLRKYDEKAFFNDIFSSGHYNCVSATALYAYIFEAKNIPYHIKEVPSHVYLIAYPNRLKISIETTVPGVNGLFIPKDSEMQKMVNKLLDLKLVTQEEVQRKGYKKVYFDYYFGEEHISKKSLIGMQYYNKSLFEFTKKQSKPALQSIMKSIHLYENPFSEVVLQMLITNNIIQLEASNQNEIQTLVKALQTMDFNDNLDKDSVRQLLYRIVDNDDNDLLFITKISKDFKKIENKELKEFCMEYFYEYLAEKHAIKRNYEQAIHNAEALLKINPKDKKAREVITYSTNGKYYNMPYTEETLLEFEKVFQKYPFIAEDKRTITLLALFYAKLTDDFSSTREETKILLYFNKLDELYNTKKNLIQINSYNLTYIYLKVGRFYYGQSKFNEAKLYFEKGLKHDPNHQELKKMLNWTIEDMN